MKVLPLPSQKRLQELFDYDPNTGVMRWKVDHRSVRIGDIAGTHTKEGYLQVQVDGKLYFGHRLIFKLVTGREPSCQIDHADCDPFNNAWSNLREANNSENRMNLRSYGAVPFKGVSKNGKKFRAGISVNGKSKYLGTYNTAEEAHEAWAKAYREHHGSEFARTK